MKTRTLNVKHRGKPVKGKRAGRKLDPLRIDPTRTGALRKAFALELRRRFARLKADVVKLVIDEDAFGLMERKHTVATLNANPEGCNQHTGPGCGRAGGEGGLSDEDALAVTAFVQGRPSAVQRARVAAVAMRSRTSRSKLVRVSRDDPRHHAGDNVEFDAGASFTGSADKVLSGGAAGDIAWKSDDGAIYLVESPTRGLDVDYRIARTMGFSASGENETVLAGRYRVKEVNRVVEPGTNPRDGYTIPQYILVENQSTLNSNPEGCNQHTGPGCGGGAPAKGLVGRTADRFAALADKVPVLRNIKAGVGKAMSAIHAKLEARYGKRAATVIMTSGALGGYGVAAAAFALTGLPGVPVVNDLVSIAVHTAAAEVGYRLGWVGNASSLGSTLDHGNEGSDAEAMEEAKRLFTEALAELLREHGAELIEQAKGVKPEELTTNSNPEGCNQHTGPGCSGGSTSRISSGKWAGTEITDPSSLRTGAPVRVIGYRGDPKAGQGKGLSALGSGRYYGLRPDVAEKFAKEESIVDHDLNLKNPVVVGSDEELISLKQQAEADTGLDFGQGQNDYIGIMRQDQAERFSGWLLSRGYDSLVSTWDGAPGGQQVVVLRGQVTNAGRFAFRSTPERLAAFREWLRAQIRTRVVSQREALDAYVRAGFERGTGRSFDDMTSGERGRELDAERVVGWQGSRRQFLKDSFAQPVAREKVELLSGRVFSDLEGVTEQMATAMTRTLADGLVQGLGPRDVARNLVRDVDGIGIRRAEVLARTEIVRAHAEGQLLALGALGVEEVGVMVEWSTAGDDKVCPACEPLEGVVLTLAEAQGMLPRHPQCRCAWVPANVGEDKDDQTRGRRDVERAVASSVEAGTEDEDEEGGAWGPGASIASERPQSILNRLTEFSREMLLFNSNPEGCNQHTGPGCGAGPSKEDKEQASRDSWNNRRGGLRETTFFTKDATPFSVVMQEVNDDVYELDSLSDLKREVMVGLGEAMDESPQEFRFENVSTGYGEREDKYGVTGTGNAKEVMRNVSDLLVGALQRFSPGFVYFTAAEESRSGLYEFLARRVGDRMPNYQGMRIETPGEVGATFALVNRDGLDSTREVLDGLGVRYHEISRDETVTYNLEDVDDERPESVLNALDAFSLFIINANPEGCNQHTGPGCGAGNSDSPVGQTRRETEGKEQT